MPPRKSRDQKEASLRANGTLNPRPEMVMDIRFRGGEFFDPRDLLQLKYEMLRQVKVDGAPVSRSAAAFGLSRPTFYAAKDAFVEQGLAGLLPRKRGPQSAHKLSEEVMDFVEEARSRDPSIPVATLVNRIRDRFQIIVHRRSIERALARRKKKRP